VNHFAEYLQQRWDEGCHNAAQLYREIREKGTWVNVPCSRVLSPTGGRAGRPRRPNVPERISPKRAAILVTRAADQITEAQQHLFERISARCPDVIDLRQMALAFRTALTGGDAAKLRLWVEGARHCEYGPMVRFAYGLRKDLLAVSAAGESPWSTGRVEGQINRLKMIKRQLYGRAGFHLLRARVLPHMPAMCAGPAP
jgi:transposase